MRIDENIRRLLENEVKIHLAEIRFLYEKLDHKFGLHAARIPVTFGFEEDSLGSYTPKAGQNEEEFHFSLLFIGYCVENPLSKATVLTSTNMNMPIICNTIWKFQRNTHGSPEYMEVHGNTAVHSSEPHLHHITKLAKVS